MNRSDHEIPKELTDLLIEYTIGVLRDQPTNLIDYAIEHFTRLKEANQTLTNSNEIESRPNAESDESMLTDEDEEPEPPPMKFQRRKSVFAEQYNPEDEEDDAEEKQDIYPKSDEQRRSLLEAVKNILLFRSLDEEQIYQVLDAMFERKVSVGENVIKQGDNGDNFYVIDSGIYNIYVDQDNNEKKLIGKYEHSGSFGELALMYNMPRAATIEAVTPGTLWAMSRQTFRRILLKNAFKKRKMYELLLNGVPMLKALNQYERMNLADALIAKTYGDKTQIIKQGDTADGMYFVEDGTVRITVISENDSEEVEISRIGKGQYFGELALVTHKPRAASAYAVGHLRLAFLDVQAFERLLGPCMDIMKRCIDDYEEQLIKIFGSKANITDIR